MKKLLTILIIFSALVASAQTSLTTAQIITRFNALDTAIARANRNISTLFAQNDSYKKQLTEAQATIAKLVADTSAKSKLIASLQAKDTISFSSSFVVTGNQVDLSADIKTSAAAVLLQSNRIAALEDWRKQVAAWVKIYVQ